MPLKTVEVEGKTYAEVQDGKAIYVLPNGTEQAYDGEALAGKLSEANQESTGRRAEIKDLDAKLKAFEGIDPAKAREAIRTVGNMKDKDLIDAGEAEQVRKAAVEAVTGELTTERDKTGRLGQALRNEMINARFGISEYMKEKIVVPAGMMVATFSGNFSVEGIDEGAPRIVAKYANGNEIFSKSNPGERASFDEALELLVEASPYRDDVLKGSGKPGSGAPGGSGNGTGNGTRMMTRDEAAKMSVERPAEFAKAMQDGTVEIADS